MPNSSTGTQFAAPGVRPSRRPARQRHGGDGQQQQDDQPRQAGQRPALAVSHVDAAQQQRDEDQRRSRRRRGRPSCPSGRCCIAAAYSRRSSSICPSSSGLPGLGQASGRASTRSRTSLDGRLGRVHALPWSVGRRGQRRASASAAARARRTGGRPRPRAADACAARRGWPLPSPISTSLMRTTCCCFGMAHGIDDDFLLISRPVLVAELVQQAALLEGGEDLGHGLVDAVQRFLRREGGAELAELLLLLLGRRRRGPFGQRRLELLPDLRVQLVQASARRSTRPACSAAWPAVAPAARDPARRRSASGCGPAAARPAVATGIGLGERHRGDDVARRRVAGAISGTADPSRESPTQSDAAASSAKRDPPQHVAAAQTDPRPLPLAGRQLERSHSLESFAFSQTERHGFRHCGAGVRLLWTDFRSV